MRLHDEGTVERYRRMGAWTDDRIDTLFQARVDTAPDRPAIVDPPNRADVADGPAQALTWAELDDRVWRAAAALHDAGVRAGDVVGVQLPNTVEIVVTFLAVVRLGGIVCPFPVQYRSHELGSLLPTTGAGVVVTAGRIGTRRAAGEAAKIELPTGSPTVLAWGGGPGSLDAMTAGADPATAQAYAATLAPDPNDCVTICWTSGTEGVPKGVPRAHCDWLAIAAGTVDGPGLGPDDVLLNPFPMVNMAGISGMFLPWLKVGGLLVMHHPFDLPTFLSQIGLHRPTYTVAPPALLTLLLRDEKLLAETDLSSLRAIGSGSAPLTPALVGGWRDRHGIEIINFYGSNEGIPLVSLPADIPDPAERAVSFPRYGAPGRRWSTVVAGWTETRLVDLETDEEITAPGRAGELRVSGPTVFAGYLAACEVDDPFDGDGFLRTGDLLEITGAGDHLLRFVDRVRDVVNRGGMKVSAAEVEGLLAGHPAVADVAVVGYPDEVMGERGCAVVVPRPGAEPTLGDLTSHLRALDVAAYKWPERLELVDQLPRNPLGKILKRELRARLAAR